MHEIIRNRSDRELLAIVVQLSGGCAHLGRPYIWGSQLEAGGRTLCGACICSPALLSSLKDTESERKVNIKGTQFQVK